MAKNYRYILEPYKGMSTRYDCPECGKRKVFTRYIDTDSGDQVAPEVGKCNREVNCGYHKTPKQYFQDHPIESQNFNGSLRHDMRARVRAECSDKTLPKSFSLIPVVVFKESLKYYETNHFITFLSRRFGTEVTSGLIARYFIGTSNHWAGATVFPQIDICGRIRTGKIMLYSADTGKRVKEPHNHITWVHSALKLPGFALKQCLFGEHLLKSDACMPVAIVESEKTAVIASLYFPDLLWLASGSLTYLTAEKCKVLSGRKVVLFPDLKCFEKWSEKAKELEQAIPGTQFAVSDLLELNANDTDKKQGLDLADYLIRFDLKLFQRQENPELENMYACAKEKKNHSETYANTGYAPICSRVKEDQKLCESCQKTACPPICMQVPESQLLRNNCEMEGYLGVNTPINPAPKLSLGYESEKGEKSEASETNYFSHVEKDINSGGLRSKNGGETCDNPVINQPKFIQPKSEKGERLKTNLFLSPQSPLPVTVMQKDELDELDTLKGSWKKGIPGNWDQDIAELKTFFKTALLPTYPIMLNPYYTLTNASIFVEGHFSFIESNNGNRTYKLYLNRLQQLKDYLTGINP